MHTERRALWAYAEDLTGRPMGHGYGTDGALALELPTNRAHRDLLRVQAERLGLGMDHLFYASDTGRPWGQFVPLPQPGERATLSDTYPIPAYRQHQGRVLSVAGCMATVRLDSGPRLTCRWRLLRRAVSPDSAAAGRCAGVESTPSAAGGPGLPWGHAPDRSATG